MKIKVCGMKDPENIAGLAKLPIDFIGLIFYSKSLRDVKNLNLEGLNILPKEIKRVGVFVNEELEIVLQKIERYKLTHIQLHGNESVEFCLQYRNLSNIEIIKAFSVSEISDLGQIKEYEEVCNYFLFDTKTPQHGGSGIKFDWSILNSYQGETPFFLSGGISIEDVEEIKKIQHPKFKGIDINSRFEIEPGVKDIGLLKKFLKKLAE